MFSKGFNKGAHRTLRLRVSLLIIWAKYAFSYEMYQNYISRISIFVIMTRNHSDHLNPKPNDSIRRLRPRSSLDHVMVCCLTTPSHYLIQWWNNDMNTTHFLSGIVCIKNSFVKVYIYIIYIYIYKLVPRPPYLYNADSIRGKTVFILKLWLGKWETSLKRFIVSMLPGQVSPIPDNHCH